MAQAATDPQAEFFPRLLRDHARIEERALFPLAAARLAPQVQAEMVREVLARDGGVDPTPVGPT